jgi:hypothetical protein
MAKGGKVGPAVSANNNGGIMGSGIFGMFGSTVVCKSDDKSLYCTLSKTVNVIMMVIFLLVILYIVYLVFKYFFGSKPTAAQQMTGGYIPGSKMRSRRMKHKSYR